MITPLIVVAAASVAMALVVFRGRTLAGYLTFDAGSYALAFLLSRLAPPQDEYFAVIALGMVKLAAFSVVLAGGRNVRWSAGRAAVLAAILYACVIPTQKRVPIDGDEPFYLLVTESMVRDHDLDLTNQYRELATSATGRVDLVPQQGDPRGSRGEQFSRHEPFLPLLLVPGYLIAGLTGALSTIALFGVLLVRSTVRLLEDEGFDDAAVRALFPFFAFAPPVIVYAARIWPEVPGAFCFVEALRGARQQRLKRAIPALFALVMLKLRFVLIACLLIGSILNDRAQRIRAVLQTRYALFGAIVTVPLLVMWFISGHWLNVHSWRELLPAPFQSYERGTYGLLLDGAGGLLFNAPFYLLGVFALFHWSAMPRAFRLGAVAALPYIASLVPRSEWHGGWSPPLRYVVIFMPLLFLGAVAMTRRGLAAGTAGSPAGERSGVAAEGAATGSFLALAAVGTIGLTLHSLAYPWRLFHIENGESSAGEWLSELHHADYSRLFPSLIRANAAATIASAAIVIAFVVFRFVRIPAPLVIPAVALLMAIGFNEGAKPGRIVEFEDAHVIHEGGELYPPFYTVARFLSRSGWKLGPGDSLSFLARRGVSYLQYACSVPVTIELDGRRYRLPPTANDHWAMPVTFSRSGRVSLRSIDGVVNLDRMVHD